MEIAAKTQNLSKDFPNDSEITHVITGISTQIHMGELTMLIGPSGCGKTTFISILSGILSPTSGEIELIGHSLNQMSDKEKVLFRREYIGFIFQQFNLLPALTAAENAAMPLLAAGIPEHEAVDRARAILGQIGMEAYVNRLPRQLSGGQQQRIAIARALVHNPKLIICDEPTASLDAKSGLAVMNILRDIANNSQRAVLVVTHDNRIYRFADRILEMSDGQIIGDCLAAEFTHRE